ncbi:hypothetical protein M404DRAFT_148892 [Pisolithus tinctorius Marx 270]|uniref:Protein kish n=1 Tax=Pisolithus tinctorius Marx 270 TaxID=870435 RepID=A0A0C3P3E2_PISTI|nr:hypothetical protein M404DRAFT_148892 [Pisolithus tinctorius Marx 270]
MVGGSAKCCTRSRSRKFQKSALFNFQSLLRVILLMICTCTYVRAVAPRLIDRNKEGILGLFFMSARIGERLSPYVAMACVAMAVTMLVQ